VPAACAGEDWALTELFRIYQPQVLRYMRRSAPGAAEDLAAEVWVGVTRSLPRFSGDEAAFRSWLFTIARCRLVEHWKAAARSRAEPMSDVLHGDHYDHVATVDGDDPALVVVEALSSRETMARATKGLTAEQAAIVRLRVVEGREVAEVARILRRSPGSVRVICLRTLRRLATRFPKGAAVVAVAACIAAAATGVATTRTVVRWLSDPPPAEAPATPSGGVDEGGREHDGRGDGRDDDRTSDRQADDGALAPGAERQGSSTGERDASSDEQEQDGAGAQTLPATPSEDQTSSTTTTDDSASTTTTTTTATTPSPGAGNSPPLPPQAQGNPPADPPGLNDGGPPRAPQADGRGNPDPGPPGFPA
jgi:RNA polymerase sigma-70 factor, ECF subfamily